jgi:hypothetical protein
MALEEGTFSVFSARHKAEHRVRELHRSSVEIKRQSIASLVDRSPALGIDGDTLSDPVKHWGAAGAPRKDTP